MTSLTLSPVSVAASLSLILLSVAATLCFLRLCRGPSLPDRVVALDTLATLLVGALILHAILRGETHSLRVATVLALVNFIGTVGFALFLRKGSMT